MGLAETEMNSMNTQKSSTTPNLTDKLDKILKAHPNLFDNPDRSSIIEEIVSNREALVMKNGAVATWTPADSTGRSPKDTYVVKRAVSEHKIDWNSPFNNPMDEDTFDALWSEALQKLSKSQRLYVTDKVVGANSSYALPTRVVVDHAIYSLFADNMFLPVPDDISNSIFADEGFTILFCPHDKVTGKYEGKLRKVGDKTSGVAIAMDMDRKLGLIIGTSYCGTMKKMVFTVMNYLLPENDILPLHCSANEGKNGDVALFLGLSGTGKTTLSSVPDRILIGDDEHGWSDEGIANFENGCYAKLIDLDPAKEPEIYHASFHEAPYREHGAIIENAMVYPDGRFDLTDSRLTENSRVSYPLSFLRSAKEDSKGGHPKTIIFLTADANGVLPPVAKLTKEQAMLWFLLGYTSKLAGTETGVTEPVSTFSRFFGGPFMTRNPDDYIEGFGKKIEEFKSSVYLINTGWTGGAYGTGKRMDINTTRSIVNAALDGALENVECTEDPRFHLCIPRSCPNVDSKILDPKATWENKDEYEAQASKLAKQFSEAFDKSYGHNNIPPEVKAQCPGK